MSATSKIELKKGDKLLLAAKDLNVANATPGNTYMSLRAVCYQGDGRFAYVDMDDLKTFGDFEDWCDDSALQITVNLEALNDGYLWELNGHAYERKGSLSEYVSDHQWSPIKEWSENPGSLVIGFYEPM